MNRGNWVLLLLVVLLLAGLGFGAWAVMNGRNNNPRNEQTNVAENPGDAPNTPPANKPDKGRTQPLAPAKDGHAPDVNKPVAPPVAPPDQPKLPVVEPPVAPETEVQTIEMYVEGRVVFHDGARPAPGAKVVAAEAQDSRFLDDDPLLPRRVGWGSPPAPSKPEGSTTTAEDGAFKLVLKLTLSRTRAAPVTPPAPGEPDKPLAISARAYNGQFRVVATLAGYAPAWSEPIFINSSALPTGNIHPEKIQLRLAPPAALRGRVVDGTTSEGIPGATIQLYMVESEGDRGMGGIMQNTRTLRTDDKGVFSATDLPAARYRTTIAASGYAGLSRFEAGRIVDLVDSPSKDMGDILLLKFGGLKGRVLEEQTNRLLAHVNVRAQTGEERWVSTQASTNDKGEFELSHVSPGIYDVYVGGSETSAAFERTGSDSSAKPEDEETKKAAKRMGRVVIENVEVKPGLVRDLGDTLLPKGAVLACLVTDLSGRPMPEAIVRLGEAPRDANVMMNDEDHGLADIGKTGPDGRIALEGLVEGQWRVRVRAPGLAVGAANFKFPYDQDELVIKLSPGGTVKGSVKDSSGRGIEGAIVLPVSQQSSIYIVAKMQPEMFAHMGIKEINMDHGVTDSAGNYEIANLPAGKYMVAAIRASPAAADTAPPSPFGSPGTGSEFVFKDDIELVEGRTTAGVDLVLAGRGEAIIKVVEDGKPVTDIKISISMGAAAFAMLGASGGKDVDAEGTVHFKDLVPGNYVVRTSRDKMDIDTDAMSKRRFTVKGGETTQYVLELKPKTGVHLFGQVTLNGKASFTVVSLCGLDERRSIFKQGAVTGGKYEFSDLTPGRYEFYAAASNEGLPAMEVLDLTREGDVRFDRDFKGFHVSGLLNTPNNSSAERSSVQVSITLASYSAEIGGLFRGLSRVDSEGGFDFGTVPAGHYKVVATLAKIGSAITEIDVENDVTDLRLNITKNCGDLKIVIRKITGASATAQTFGLLSIEDAQGKPLTFADPQTAFMNFSQGTEHAVNTVPPGSYTVIFRPLGFVLARATSVLVEVGKVTEVPLDLLAAAELRVTFGDTSITQEICDRATITLLDAQGKVVPVGTSMLDGFFGKPTFNKPTVNARTLGPEVAQVRIKLPGYAEFSVAFAFETGKKFDVVQETTPE
ncbi:MAG: carboxypeptidase regulatory-like domain-containing protein [Planctomycetes bacterium]|nr:carboxypeptidase regulatory-like domain-containing protein [Planctomycetota bacterium]